MLWTAFDQPRPGAVLSSNDFRTSVERDGAAIRHDNRVCGRLESLPAARADPSRVREVLARHDCTSLLPLAKEPANTVLLDEGGAIPHSPFVASIGVISLVVTRLCEPFAKVGKWADLPTQDAQVLLSSAWFATI